MSKTVRVVLYIVSLLMVAGVIVLFAVTGRGQRAEDAMQQEQVSELEDTAADKEPGNGGDAGTEKLIDEETAAAGDEADTEDIDKDTAADTIDTETETGDEANTDVGDGETTILFTGDVLFANAFKAGYDANGLDGVLALDLQQALKDADILMVNNEFPFSDRGTPMADKQFTFTCSPSYVKALNEMGVDVVSLANNHTLDYGKEALSDTFATLDKAGILYGGAGESVERAEEVQVIEVNGKKFGFLAVSRVIPVADWKVENSAPGIFSCYDETRLVALVEEAKKECDFLAVYPHWGVEYAAQPEDYQTRIAERCIAAGADVIVGSHTHCLQGASYIEGKPVFYSLGNFIFGQNIDRSAILKVTVDAEGDTYFTYLPVYAAGGVTNFAKGDAATEILNYLDRISDAAVGADGAVTE